MKDKFFTDLQDLAIKSRAGDKASYTLFLKSVSIYAKNMLASSINDKSSLDDIAQEVLISVHKSLHTYSEDRPIKPWLYSIINFRKIDYLRKYYKRAENEVQNVDDDFINIKNVTNMRHAGEYKDIERALESLPDKQREIFKMVRIDGYTSKEVANMMDMTESAIKVSVHRTGGKLREILNEE